MPTESNRPRRIAGLLQRELSDLIRREVSDPRVGDVTLTAVEVSRDLASARVYFTVFDKGHDVKDVTRALNHAAGYLRHHLRSRVDLRGIPNLRFVYDESLDRGERIDSLIDRGRHGADENPEPDQDEPKT
jgi:ribosome-binding factor A